MNNLLLNFNVRCVNSLIKNAMFQVRRFINILLLRAGMTVTNYYNGNGQNATATVGTNATFSNATIITLAVLEGAVAVRNLRDADGTDDHDDVMQHLLVSGEAINVTGQHSVTTMGATPSCYVLYVDATTGTSTVASVAVDDSSRPSRRCSDACYTFVVDAIKTTLFAIFS